MADMTQIVTPRLRTDRLELVAATPAMLKAELSDRAHLSELLSADIPAGWPPELLDEDAIEYTLRKVGQDAEHQSWSLWFAILTDHHQHTLIGSVGYKGPPDASGMVEVGYGILPEFQHHGYATEATNSLIDHAFDHDNVSRVIAETYPELTPSIRVMEKCGFAFIGDGSEDRVIRYELTRETWRALSTVVA